MNLKAMSVLMKTALVLSSAVIICNSIAFLSFELDLKSLNLVALPPGHCDACRGLLRTPLHPRLRFLDIPIFLDAGPLV